MMKGWRDRARAAGILLAVAAASGCGPATGESPAAEAEEVVREFVAVWSSHDPERVPLILSEDAVYEDTAFDVLLTGREQITGFFAQSWVAVPDLEMKVVSMFSSGGMVATQWMLAGTHTGDYPGLPATNKRFSIRGVGITEVEGGKIRRHTDYYDEAEFRRQLGLLEDPPEEGEIPDGGGEGPG